MSLAALQRHRLREKLSALCLEPAPPSAAFSVSCPTASASAPGPVVTSAAPSKKDQTKTTMPFPDPTRSHLGLENMTQTFIDNNDGVISPERQDGNTPPQPQTQLGDTRNKRCLSLSTVRKMPQRAKRDRISGESATPHLNPPQHLGNVYDEQLERRAGNSSKSKRRKRSASSTRKGERERRMDVNSSFLLNPVKRCLYTGDDDGEEKLLTPVKYVEGNDGDQSENEADDEEEDPFTTIGHYLPLIE